MLDFLVLLIYALAAPLRTQAQLEAEIIILRHQLNVLRRNAPLKPKLVPPDRLLFVWLYRLFPSALNAVAIVSPRQSSGGIGLASPLLALEVALAWRSANSSTGDSNA